MYTPAEWKAKENELEMLKAKREALRAETAEISRCISILSANIAHYKKRMETTNQAKTESFVHQMFGKSIKDLTPNERRRYYSARQTAINEKRKENAKC